MKGKVLIAILIIILLVVYYFFGMDYKKQRKEHVVLTSQITEITETLAQIPEPPRDLEQRLAAAKASLAAEQSAFPSKINSTQVINTILELADDYRLRAISLETQPWSREKVGQHDYHIFRLNVIVEGTFSQLVTFISELESGELKTLIVEDLSVTTASEQPEEGSVPAEPYLSTASLDIAVYTQSLTTD